VAAAGGTVLVRGENIGGWPTTRTHPPRRQLLARCRGNFPQASQLRDGDSGRVLLRKAGRRVV
jgi:hypothetical protein